MPRIVGIPLQFHFLEPIFFFFMPMFCLLGRSKSAVFFLWFARAGSNKQVTLGIAWLRCLIIDPQSQGVVWVKNQDCRSTTDHAKD